MGSWLGKSLASIAAGQGSVLPMTNGIWFWSVVISGVAWTLVQRYGDRREPPLRRFASSSPVGGDHASDPAKPVPRHALEADTPAANIGRQAPSKP
jgi:DHA1 family bicyclomycin/chloramphenicol resistance-like MFS transporter